MRALSSALTAATLLVLAIGGPAGSTARQYNDPVEVAPGVMIANLEAALDERAADVEGEGDKAAGAGDGSERDESYNGGWRSRRSLGSLKPLKVTKTAISLTWHPPGPRPAHPRAPTQPLGTQKDVTIRRIPIITGRRHGSSSRCARMAAGSRI